MRRYRDCHKKLVVVVTATTTSLSDVPQFDEEFTMLSPSATAKQNAYALVPHPTRFALEVHGHQL